MTQPLQNDVVSNVENTLDQAPYAQCPLVCNGPLWWNNEEDVQEASAQPIDIDENLIYIKSGNTKTETKNVRSLKCGQSNKSKCSNCETVILINLILSYYGDKSESTAVSCFEGFQE